jgi:murein DD-endopeptidase MepM/ murein hydrolase activator NlpD
VPAILRRLDVPLALLLVAGIAAAQRPPYDGPLVPARSPQPEPTAAELSMLRAALSVPVAGVASSALPDNFSEPRLGHRHAALDILAPRGADVLSATDGRVLQISENKDGGLMVFAADATGRFLLLYAHLERYAPGLKTGMALQRGQVIGAVGTSGNAPPNTPHLHFAIEYSPGSLRWSHGVPIDPRPLLLP